MCNEIKKVQNNKMCKKKQKDVQKNNKMCKKQ